MNQCMFSFSSHVDSSLGFFFIFLGKTRSLILKARKQPTVHLVTSHGCRASPWCRGEGCLPTLFLILSFVDRLLSDPDAT